MISCLYKHTVRKTAIYDRPLAIDTPFTNMLCHVPMVIREKKHNMVPLRLQMSAVYEYHAVS